MDEREWLTDREKREQDELEKARALLTQNERAALERHRAEMLEQGIYTTRHAIELARVLRAPLPDVHQAAEIREVKQRAEREAKERADRQHAEENRRREQQAVREAALEQQRAAERQARQAAARREPMPGSVEKFGAHLGQQPAARSDTRALSGDEILGRFGDAGLEARYRREQQERNARDYSDLSRPLTASDYVERSNTPAEKIIEPPATREKFTRDAKGDKFTREDRDEKFTRAMRDRDDGGDGSADRNRDDGRDR